MGQYDAGMTKCTFCEIAAGRLPAWTVYEDDYVIAFFDKGSIAEFHTLVIPKRHATNIFDVDADDFLAVASAIRHISQSFKKDLGIEAVQIISSNGVSAQQDAFHMHFHIVPRTIGDGHDISWTPDPSIRERFDELLARVAVGPMIG